MRGRLAVHHGVAIAVRDEDLRMAEKWRAWNEATMKGEAIDSAPTEAIESAPKEAIESAPKEAIERAPAPSFRL